MKPTSGSSRLNIFFGCPYNPNMTVNTQWEAENICYLDDLPFPMRIAWATTQKATRLRVHKKIASSVRQALDNVWASARSQMKEKYGYNQTSTFYDNKALAYLRLKGLDLYGGGYEYRPMRGSSKLSMHSYGIAVDLDPAHNAQGKKPTLPDWYVKCWKAAGFTWGGDFPNKRVDGMHFEKLVPPKK